MAEDKVTVVNLVPVEVERPQSSPEQTLEQDAPDASLQTCAVVDSECEVAAKVELGTSEELDTAGNDTVDSMAAALVGVEKLELVELVETL